MSNYAGILHFSVICFVIYKVLINIRTSGSQFGIYVLLHGYQALQKQSFDTYLCSLGLSVAKKHVVI